MGAVAPRSAWSPNFDAQKEGTGCPMCADGGNRNDFGARFRHGRWTDAYLGRRPVRPGYAYVVWTGPHVAEPTELDPHEAAGFWAEVAIAASAIEARYRPRKMNWMSLGNGVPHLHVHLVPRHDDDPDAGGPVEAEAFDAASVTPLDDAVLESEVAALRRLVDGGSSSTTPSSPH